MRITLKLGSLLSINATGMNMTFECALWSTKCADWFTFDL